MIVLLADAVDVFERWSIPIGIAIALVILFATKVGRKSIEDSYTKGKQYREKREGKEPGDATEPRYKAPVWHYVFVFFSVIGIGALLMRLLR